MKLDIDGTTEQLTPTGQSFEHPALSPNGRQLVFVRGSDDQLWIAPIHNLGAAKQFTYGPPGQYGATSPVFLPDGNAVVYGAYQGWGYVPWDWGVSLATVDGSSDQQLLSGKEVPWLAPVPAVSPDGRLVTFSQSSESSSRDYVKFFRISDGKTWMFKSERSVWSPSFSPDGHRVTFMGLPDEDAMLGEVFISGRDGSEVRQLTTDGVAKAAPLFSPDGKYIAYKQWGLDQSEQIVVINLATGATRTIDTPGDNAALVQWTRERVFRVIGYGREKRVVKVRVFNPGLVRVSGPGVKFVERQVKRPGTQRIRLKWKSGFKRSKITVTFRPIGSVVSTTKIWIRR